MKPDIVVAALSETVMRAKREVVRGEGLLSFPIESLDVVLKKDDYNWIWKWKVASSYHGPKGFSGESKKFRRYDDAVAYFRHLVDTYNLEMVAESELVPQILGEAA